MKFKLDENLPVSSAAILASTGHDVDSVTEEGLIGAPDRDVVAAATAAGRVLISLDRGLGDIRAYDEQHQDGHGTHPCQVVYRHAQPGAALTDIFGTWSPPAANVRLWEFRNVAITSYSGTRGTICGPWPAERHLAAPVITVRMIPLPPRTAAGTSASW